MMTTFFLAAAVVYVGEILWLTWGLRRTARSRAAAGSEPTVSIIVAARNEEERISDCLRSLAALHYPPERLEIVVVDDRSTDRTAEIVRQFCQEHPAIRTVTSGLPEGSLQGKANALVYGIESSRGEILMFTDADCSVPPTWVEKTVGYFDGATGVVGGFTLLDAERAFEGMQQIDWLFLFGIASSTAGWNTPLTVIGNNLSVRRSAYDAVGGYRNIPFSVTEDYTLVQAILRTTQFKVQFPLDAGTLVHSKACQNWRQLYRQKQRWVVGGLDMVLEGLLIMGVGWVYRLALIICWAFVDPLLFTLVAAGVLCSELFYVSAPLRRFSSLGSLRYFPAFQAYYLPLVLLSPLIALISKNIVWKERTHRKHAL